MKSHAVRDGAMLNRFIISWLHSIVPLVSFLGPSGINDLLKSQPLCMYLANISGQLLDQPGIGKLTPSLAPWGNVSIMDAAESKYAHCIFCSKDFNENLWRNMNGANTPTVHALLYSQVDHHLCGTLSPQGLLS